jgi:hypothetical protein
MKCRAIFLFILFSMLFTCVWDLAEAQNDPDPRWAFLRSMAIPGWGHYYADSDNWNRGKLHMATEAALITAVFGVRSRAYRLEQQYITLASLKAGVDLSARTRGFHMAVGDYRNLEEYNDYQLRSRNWHRLIDNIPENRWQWPDEKRREQFNSLRSDRDRTRNQLPAIAGLMVVNRVVSAISAYNRVQGARTSTEVALLPGVYHNGTSGLMAVIDVRF